MGGFLSLDYSEPVNEFSAGKQRKLSKRAKKALKKQALTDETLWEIVMNSGDEHGMLVALGCSRKSHLGSFSDNSCLDEYSPDHQTMTNNRHNRPAGNDKRGNDSDSGASSSSRYQNRNGSSANTGNNQGGGGRNESTNMHAVKLRIEKDVRELTAQIINNISKLRSAMEYKKLTLQQFMEQIKLTIGGLLSENAYNVIDRILKNHEQPNSDNLQFFTKFLDKFFTFDMESGIEIIVQFKRPIPGASQGGSSNNRLPNRNLDRFALSPHKDKDVDDFKRCQNCHHLQLKIDNLNKSVQFVSTALNKERQMHFEADRNARERQEQHDIHMHNEGLRISRLTAENEKMKKCNGQCDQPNEWRRGERMEMEKRHQEAMEKLQKEMQQVKNENKQLKVHLGQFQSNAENETRRCQDLEKKIEELQQENNFKDFKLKMAEKKLEAQKDVESEATTSSSDASEGGSTENDESLIEWLLKKTAFEKGRDDTQAMFFQYEQHCDLSLSKNKKTLKKMSSSVDNFIESVQEQINAIQTNIDMTYAYGSAAKLIPIEPVEAPFDDAMMTKLEKFIKEHVVEGEKIKEVSSDESEECPICSYPLNAKQTIECLNCTGIVHLKCQEKWAKAASVPTCVLCRALCSQTYPKLN